MFVEEQRMAAVRFVSFDSDVAQNYSATRSSTGAWGHKSLCAGLHNLWIKKGTKLMHAATE